MDALMRRRMMMLSDDWGELERSETVTGSMSNELLSSYDTDDSVYASLSDVSNAYTGSNSTYALIGLVAGENAETKLYFKWDTSSIPDNVTISSVACRVRGTISNTTAANVASRNVRMCSGTTPKGSAENITGTVTDRILSVGTWTRDELRDCRLLFYAKRGTSNTSSSYTMRAYWGKLTVNYSYEQYYYTVKVKNNVTGLTVSPETYEYEAGDTVTLTFSGLSSGFVVKDNDVDVTSQLVSSGSDLVYTISDISEGHKIIVKEA